MLSRLLDPELAGQFLHRHLPFFRQANAPSLRAVKLRDVRLGKWWEFQYHLQVETNGAGPASRHIVTCHYTDQRDLSRMVRKVERQRELVRSRGSLLELLWLDHSETGLVVVPFPLDPKLPHLPEATDLDEATKEFARSRLIGDRGAPSIKAVDVLRYVSGRRCQIRYHFRGREGSGALLGKTFRDDRGRSLSRVMNQVADLFHSHANAELSAPRSPGYLPEWKMVVQQDVKGTTMNRLARSGTLEEEQLTTAGQCLAVLHNSSLQLSGQHSIEQELELLGSTHARLQRAGYSSQTREDLLKQLVQFGQSLKVTRLCPVHRDFYDKQLLIRESRLFLIDLDTATFGCPEIDVANFVAHLRLRALQQVGLPCRNWERLFLHSYSRSASTPNPVRFRFFLAATFFRLGCRYRLRFQGRQLAVKLFRLAGEALIPSSTEVPERGVVREL